MAPSFKSDEMRSSESDADEISLSMISTAEAEDMHNNIINANEDNITYLLVFCILDSTT